MIIKIIIKDLIDILKFYLITYEFLLRIGKIVLNNFDCILYKDRYINEFRICLNFLNNNNNQF